MFVLSRHISKDTAGLWISLFYATVMAGRFLSGVIVNKLGNRALIRMGLLTGILGSAIMFLRTVPFAGMVGLLLIGLGLAPIFPCMMHETPRRFDKKTSDILIGYQVGFAYLGGSALPALLGLIFSSTSLEMLTPCLIISLIAMLLLSEKLYRQKGSAMKTS
jgi:fucose permease